MKARTPWIFLLWQRIEFPLYFAIAITLFITVLGSLWDVWSTHIIPWFRGQSALDALEILDQLLFISMLVEILQMVKISLGTQLRLAAEPFLIVGLISVIRRVLIITAESTRFVVQLNLGQFALLVIELGVLGLLAFVFVRGLYLLRRQRLVEIPPAQEPGA